MIQTIIALIILIIVIIAIRNSHKSGRKKGSHAVDNFNLALIQSSGVPMLATRPDVIQKLEITDKDLSWFLNNSLKHYKIFYIKKKSGGQRTLYAPKKRLRKIQKWIYAEILAKIKTDPAAHGFVKGRSIITNAQPHTGQDIVLNIDLQNFFDSVPLWRAVYAFRSVGYSSDVSTILGRLCCAGGRLRQGLPTSPALTNLVCRKLDCRLNGLARKFRCAYTRYADDITFSGDKKFKSALPHFIPLLRKIIKSEGFRINKSKMRIAHKGNRQEVTGLVVNQKVSIPRDILRRWRAIFHNCAIKGIDTQNRDNHKNFKAHLVGILSYIYQISPAKTQTFMKNQ